MVSALSDQIQSVASKLNTITPRILNRTRLSEPTSPRFCPCGFASAGCSRVPALLLRRPAVLDGQCVNFLQFLLQGCVNLLQSINVCRYRYSTRGHAQSSMQTDNILCMCDAVHCKKSFLTMRCRCRSLTPSNLRDTTATVNADPHPPELSTTLCTSDKRCQCAIGRGTGARVTIAGM